MRLSFLTLLCLLAGPLFAHEFWIDPARFQVDGNEEIIADIRVGQGFSGARFSYDPRRFRRFDLVLNGQVMPVPGRPGDRPAMTMPAPDEGLAVVVHVTADTLLTYRDRETFETFVRHKDFDGVLAAHRARGLPDSGFRERYSRYAKSLIAIARGRGQDRQQGLVTEIVALANPYTDDLGGTLPVRVLYHGEPRADVQVELYGKTPQGEVTVTLHRTDADGVARLPVRPGHRYLVDAVVMRPLEPAGEMDPVWESLWASLTFAVR